jgi:hypothetical protein
VPLMRRFCWCRPSRPGYRFNRPGHYSTASMEHRCRFRDIDGAFMSLPDGGPGN